MKKWLALLLCAVMALSLTTAMANQVLTMGTGGTSGTYYAFGSEIAQMWNKNVEGVEVVPQVTGASKVNIVSVCDRALDMLSPRSSAPAFAWRRYYSRWRVQSRCPVSGGLEIPRVV